MPNPTEQTFAVTGPLADQTLAAALRQWLPEQSWSQVRRLIAARRVRLNGELILDPARRVHAGDTVALLGESAPPPRHVEAVVICHLDEHVVVVEKPAGIPTVRHPSERDWKQHRRALAPTLDDLTQQQIVAREGRPRKGPPPRLRIVHRIDKETSGLVVFARTTAAESGLGKQFQAHTVTRRYLTVVPGFVLPQRIASRLMRDRGDGRRGSTTGAEQGKEAVTHVGVIERLPGYTLLECRLETGRTHQIRIHLAELGHPVCGDRVYRGKLGLSPIEDESGAPRLALHAAELGFVHPATGAKMGWAMPLPDDLQEFLARLRSGAGRGRWGAGHAD
ncbi:MAG: RluA family pseudouridine synthase [Gemmataceae bacterium]|nr:RluA family pseudouridine synthase [Gemmataceae bacterium]